VGSIRAGKAADLVAVSLRGIAPMDGAAAQLAHGAGPEHVSHVWVNGVLRLGHPGAVMADWL
jgi:5-methylthioadenosine/S-adenosylhomocysteine deaminase